MRGEKDRGVELEGEKVGGREGKKVTVRGWGMGKLREGVRVSEGEGWKKAWRV